MLNKITSFLLIFVMLFGSIPASAESVDDKFTQISPTHTPGAGEFVHGQGYGKILVRLMMFGAISQQGVHYVPEGTDLLFAILYAGGYSDNTKLDGITIRRRGQEELISVDLEELMQEGAKIPKMMDGDIVTIPYNWRRDISTISIITGFIAAMTGFTISLISLSK